MNGAAVQVLPGDRNILGSGELKAVLALPSPPSLSQDHRDLIYGIPRAAVNIPVVKLKSSWQLVSAALAAAVS